MSNDTQLTITGNLVDDPESRYTPNGQPAVRFRIASTPRFYDKAGESAGCPAMARSRSPPRADLAAPNITQVRRPRSPTPCHDQFWAAKITRASPNRPTWPARSRSCHAGCCVSAIPDRRAST